MFNEETEQTPQWGDKMAWVYIKENIRPRMKQKIRSLKQLVAHNELLERHNAEWIKEVEEQSMHERFIREADNQNTLYRT